ncbi:MAG: hypothetical protein HY401_08440 [Elusimicrobia bacterium]|nr:hypothetical protein [Elusimicrobiota bacterium]
MASRFYQLGLIKQGTARAVCHAAHRFQKPLQIKSTPRILPDSDADQNLVTLSDEFGFGIILTYRGPKRLLTEEQCLAHLQSREKRPKPPKIQELLRLAMSLRTRFKNEPDLSYSHVAGELGVSRPRVYQIMNLLKLRPSLQSHILKLRLTSGRTDLTERRLRQQPTKAI